jgi:hypothetical protein
MYCIGAIELRATREGKAVMRRMEAEALGGVFRPDVDRGESAWVPVADMPRWELARSLKGSAAACAAGGTKGPKQHR